MAPVGLDIREPLAAEPGREHRSLAGWPPRGRHRLALLVLQPKLSLGDGQQADRSRGRLLVAQSLKRTTPDPVVQILNSFSGPVRTRLPPRMASVVPWS